MRISIPIATHTATHIAIRASFLGLLIVAAAAAQQINVEFDQNADFSQFHTFAIRDGQINSRNPALNNDLVKQRIEAAITERLMAKGLTKAAGKADLNVRYSLGSANKREVESYPAGWRGRATRRVAVRVAEGTLVIDLRDPDFKALVWRAIATDDENNPQKLAGKLDAMVRKSIDKYPPKK